VAPLVPATDDAAGGVHVTPSPAPHHGSRGLL